MIKVIFICLLALMATACSKVPAGNVGIKFYLLGGSKGVDTEEVPPGRYWIGMNEELYLFPTFTQTVDWNDVTFQTVEGMKVTGSIGMSYAINPTKVTDLFVKYRKGIDEITNTYLRNMVRDALVNAASTRKVESVYGQGKEELISEAEKRVKAQVEPLGINIERLYWAGQLVLPPEVTNSLNAKIKATQMAQQRRNEVEQAKAEADKLIEAARGEAESRLMIARAEAESINIKGKAISENPRVVELSWIEKWNGKMPVVSGQTTPLISIPLESK
jgi:regulator of protease activity HflC (stomatin/prohibitin superfamily)